MSGRFGSMVLLALAACLLGSLPSAVDAHAALLTPTSRNEAFWPGQWISNAGNGLGGGRPAGFPGELFVAAVGHSPSFRFELCQQPQQMHVQGLALACIAQAQALCYRSCQHRFGSQNIPLYSSLPAPTCYDCNSTEAPIMPMTTPCSTSLTLPPTCLTSCAGVCRDPYQGISSDLTTFTTGPVTSYTAGQRVSFRVRMQVNHGGRLTFRICDRSTGLDQNCFTNGRTLLR
jgi:hypothetical protein